MSGVWYPQNKRELNSVLEEFLSVKIKDTSLLRKQINGLIVPHAGYQFSGKIAGEAFSLLKDKQIKRAVILSPSHYTAFYGVASLKSIETPLGKVKITKNDYPTLNYEHAIDNQIPFLQKLNVEEVLPLIIGELSKTDAEQIGQKINLLIKDNSENSKKPIIIVSTDLSHFLPYGSALKIDKRTIKIIENLDISHWEQIDACGRYPLLVLMYLCRENNWRPKLIEYKNSGDVSPETRNQGVVGYASFLF